MAKRHNITFNTEAEYLAFKASSGYVEPNVSYVAQDNDVHYNKYVDPYAGHKYVDLGLPSGTKWATMNIGASSETDYGLFFQWGDTQGYTASEVGSGDGKKYFSWTDYKYNEGGTASSYGTITKYNNSDGLTVLQSSDDAVAAAWGGNWRMPTETEFNELLNTSYCTNAWTSITVDNTTVYGILFTSKSNGNTLFFPAAGYCAYGSVSSEGMYGGYWSSSLYTSLDVDDGMNLGFSMYDCGPSNGSRSYGSSIRGVVDQ